MNMDNPAVNAAHQRHKCTGRLKRQRAEAKVLVSEPFRTAGFGVPKDATSLITGLKPRPADILYPHGPMKKRYPNPLHIILQYLRRSNGVECFQEH